MRTPVQSLAAGASALAIALACAGAAAAQSQQPTAPAPAGPVSNVINDQVQLGDVWAEQTLIVEGAEHGLASTTNAMGNSLAASVENTGLNFVNSQRLAGDVTGQSHVQAMGTAGPLCINSTSATGNPGEAAACCGDVKARVQQTVESTAPISALAYSAAGYTTQLVSSTAQAVGNTQSYAAYNGNVRARTQQEVYAPIVASNRAEFCCITGAGAFAATAVANSMSSHVEHGQARHEVVQVMGGPVTGAYNDVYAVTGNNIVGMATATANTAFTYNTGNYAELKARQRNEGRVEAESYVVLDTWYGVGQSHAYGVGNTADLISPDAYMATHQTNNGDISATAVFDGGAGEHVVASSMAVGNATSGYACATCSGSLDAQNYQVNRGDVRAGTHVYTQYGSGLVIGSATAVGNTASYTSQSSGD